MAVASAFGQEPSAVLAPEPELTESAPALPPPSGGSDNAQRPSLSQPDSELDFLPVAPPVQRWRLVLEGAIRFTYDDNVHTRPINPESDLVLALAPRASLEFGDFRDRKENFLLMSYAPTAFFFLEGNAQNTVDHDASFEAQAILSRLTLTTKLHFQSLSDTDIDVGDRTTRQIYSAAFGARYDLLPKTTLTLDVNLFDYEYQTRIDSREGVLKLGLDYQFSEKLTLGLAFGGGLLKPADSDTQTYEVIGLRGEWKPTEKFSIVGEAGGDFRQLELEDRAEPVGLIGAYWEPTDSTLISLEVSESVRASAALSGRNYIASMIRAKVRQRFFQKFFASVRGGYTHSEYYATRFDLPSNRIDDYWFVRPSLEFVADHGWRVEAYYQYRTNDSNESNVTFNNNQVGMEFSIAF